MLAGDIRQVRLEAELGKGARDAEGSGQRGDQVRTAVGKLEGGGRGGETDGYEPSNSAAGGQGGADGGSQIENWLIFFDV